MTNRCGFQSRSGEKGREEEKRVGLLHTFSHKKDIEAVDLINKTKASFAQPSARSHFGLHANRAIEIATAANPEIRVIRLMTKLVEATPDLALVLAVVFVKGEEPLVGVVELFAAGVAAELEVVAGGDPEVVVDPVVGVVGVTGVVLGEVLPAEVPPLRQVLLLLDWTVTSLA